MRVRGQVSFFVRADSRIDEYAATRGTTTYLTQYCLPMLPHTLSEELCSLNPKEDRLAFSVVWRFTADGELLPPPSASSPYSCDQPDSLHAAARGRGSGAAGAAKREMGGMAGGGTVWVDHSSDLVWSLV